VASLGLRLKALTPSRQLGTDDLFIYSDLIAKEQIPDPHNVDLWLRVNGDMRQNGNTKDMIFSIPELISYVSSIMTLETGDVLLTGMSVDAFTL